MAITRTPMVDDDGSGTTGTIINAAWKVELYDQIDAALAVSGGSTGTWQPLLEGMGGATGQSYAIRSGRWARLGDVVTITGSVALSAKGTLTGATAAIGNLPFPVGTLEATGAIAVSFFASFSATLVYLTGYPRSGTSRIELGYLAAAAPVLSFVPVSMITDGTDIRFSGVYATA